MIKINLLESVTDRSKGVAVVEQKVTNPFAQTLLLAVVVCGLLVAGMGFDVISSRWALSKAQSDLEEQQRIAMQMAAINKEQVELEKRTKDVQTRIDAIQKLRSSQQGPVAVLRELKDRIDSAPGLYLESVQQKGDELIIKGNSPNEAAVTMFGRSLEFSSGLFTNLNIETARKELSVPATEVPPAGTASNVTIEKPETVDFTIKCNYTPGKASSSGTAPANNAPATQVAQK